MFEEDAADVIILNTQLDKKKVILGTLTEDELIKKIIYNFTWLEVPEKS